MGRKPLRDWGGKTEKLFLKLLQDGYALNTICKALETSAHTLTKRYGHFIDAHKRGVLASVYTDEQRTMVWEMTAQGLRNDQVAKVMGISETSLRTNFATELHMAQPMVNAEVAGRLLDKCREGDMRAITFWLSCRASWVKPIPRCLECESRGIARAVDPALLARVRQLEAVQRMALERALDEMETEQPPLGDTWTERIQRLDDEGRGRLEALIDMMQDQVNISALVPKNLPVE